VDRDGRYSEFLAGALDAQCNLATVRDQDFIEHI
jgi:hypothetical protein